MATAKVDSSRPSQTSSAQGDAVSPRKRRKRVGGAAGASNDCFNCSTRSVNCDRRRPFCSKCLDDGKECSGYKTQLKWGVGVASRGKLRGLALPIAGTQQVAGHPPVARPKKMQILSPSQEVGDMSSCAVPNSSPSQFRNTELSEQQQFIALPGSLPSQASNNWQEGKFYPSSISETQHYTAVQYNFSPTSSLPNNFLNHESLGPISPLIPDSPSVYPPQSRFLTQPGIPSVTLSTSPADHLSHFLLPQFCHVSATPPMPQPTSHPQAASFFSFQGGALHGHGRVPYDTPPQHDEPLLSRDIYWPQLQQFYVQPLNSPAYSESASFEADDRDSLEGMCLGTVDSECTIVKDQMAAAPPDPSVDLSVLCMAPVISYRLGIGSTPRMKFLIKYFAQVISPVIVAFDGLKNPYRTLILNLAAENESLQHAISALAASNLRQRQNSGALSAGRTSPARMSTTAYINLTEEERSKIGPVNHQDRLSEEEYHKRYAIRLLNSQLADPVAHKSDSVLAILLILLLVHICDSGIANFQIEFAGVKKLLELRQNDLRRETKLFTQMFTLFDAMTASVNNREGHIHSHHLELSAICDDEWSLCNLAGCDQELLKVLFKLGRLNVLSQGKRVELNPPVICKAMPPASSPALAANINDSHSHVTIAINDDGWGQLAADEDLFHSRTIGLSLHEQFWREWYETRQALQMWQHNPATFTTTSLFSGQKGGCSAPSELTNEQYIDLVNISESFRYAALLYTERLAHPHAASLDANIVNWVRHGLYFIRQVKSDAYLLWPLFIIGAECVDERDISVIRDRCVNIQKDSGFLNNKSTLDLLEKIWAAAATTTTTTTTNTPAPTSTTIADSIHDQTDYNYLQGGEGEVGGAQFNFRFSKIMGLEGSQGEYLVV